jgi:hypothetical protein
MRRRRAARHRWQEILEDDPGAGLLNLFDVWIAFAVALLLAMVSYMKVPELMNASSSITLIANAGGIDMELIRKNGTKIERYRATSEQLTGQGERLGTAYRLTNGEVVYVPERPGAPAPATPPSPR